MNNDDQTTDPVVPTTPADETHEEGGVEAPAAEGGMPAAEPETPAMPGADAPVMPEVPTGDADAEHEDAPVTPVAEDPAA